MGLLKFAVEKQRWDLAAHAVVLATVRVLNQGVKPDVRTNKAKKRSAQR